MNKLKYKVGDTIRIIPNKWGGVGLIGKIGFVVVLMPGDRREIYIALMKGGAGWVLDDSMCELVENYQEQKIENIEVGELVETNNESVWAINYSYSSEIMSRVTYIDKTMVFLEGHPKPIHRWHLRIIDKKKG